MLRHTLLLATALSFSPLVTSQYFNADGVQNRYILYNGTVSGTFKHGDDYPSSCNDVKLGSNKNSLLAVGVHPEWDNNPIFFELYHLSSEGGGGIVSFTDDTIYNLDFTSAASVCMKDGKVCGMVELNPTYKPTELLDLSKAAIKKTNIKGDSGYSVSGDKSTWSSDDTIKSEVDIARPKGAELDRCLSKEHFTWNASTPFKYNIKFTNTTSKADLSITSPKGSLTLSFSGERDDNPSERFASSGGPIELDTNDSSTPKFKGVDGSKISFNDDGDSSSSSSGGSNSSGTSPTSASGTNAAPETTQTGGTELLNARNAMVYWVAGSVVPLLGYFS